MIEYEYAFLKLDSSMIMDISWMKEETIKCFSTRIVFTRKRSQKNREGTKNAECDTHMYVFASHMTIAHIYCIVFRIIVTLLLSFVYVFALIYVRPPDIIKSA